MVIPLCFHETKYTFFLSEPDFFFQSQNFLILFLSSMKNSYLLMQKITPDVNNSL